MHSSPLAHPIVIGACTRCDSCWIIWLKDGQVTCDIGIKGRAGDGDVAFGVNEWIKAQRVGSEHWVYILTKAEPKPHMIQGLTSQLRPKEEVKIVRYMVARNDWANVSERRR